MIFHEQPTDPWIPFDFKLLEAFQMLEDETCPLCNKPIWLCRSEDPNLQFKVLDAVCFADRELKLKEDARNKKTQKDSEKRKEFGKYYYTVPYMVNNSELPSRKAFYEANAVE